MRKSVLVASITLLLTCSKFAQAQEQTPEEPKPQQMVWILFPTPNNGVGTIGLPAQDFNPQRFYACMAYYESFAGLASFAMGPAGPGFFFAASFAAAANCGYNASN